MKPKLSFKDRMKSYQLGDTHDRCKHKDCSEKYSEVLCRTALYCNDCKAFIW